MKLHGNASLTVGQRRLIHEMYHSNQAKKSELARRFNVNLKTINRWVNRDSPYDKASGPKNPKKVITPAYWQAVIDYRNLHPDHGPITIAHSLKDAFSFANRGTVQRILRQEGLSQRSPKKQKRGVR